jgi:phenylpyruvate tautomerase PptA (4-oxalocrotonate tautomerase family)
MPVVIIHLSPETKPSDQLAKDVHEAVADVLGISQEHVYVMVCNSASTRWVHESCDANFVFVEIFMFSGRSDEMKEKLFSRLTEIIARHTKVGGRDILLNLIESDRNNWARDGVQMSKVS